MKRGHVLIALALVAVLATALPATGASPTSTARKALKVAKKAQKLAQKAVATADGANGTAQRADARATEANATAQRALQAVPRRAQDPLWIDHLSLESGDSSVDTSANAVNSGVGGGLAGLVIESSTTGEVADGGGNKVVWRALELPPDYTVTGVRVCYELSSTRSFVSQIRLSQVEDPPSRALVRLDDPTDRTNRGPVCVNSASTSIDPAQGPLLLDLRVNFGDVSDRIVVRGLGVRLEPKP